MEYKMINKIKDFLDKELAKLIDGLSSEEKKVLEYFLQNISVGGIIAQRELRAFYGIENPRDVIRRLIELGILEQGYGCYNLAKKLREILIKITIKQIKEKSYS